MPATLARERSTPEMPRTTRPDSTVDVLFDPYGFISKKCQELNSDVFQTRLLLRKTVCMLGREAAQLFSDQDRFVRAGVVPGRIQKTLFGQGGVQGLDDAAHRHRKQMFLSLMSPERIDQLTNAAAEKWRAAAADWTRSRPIVLYSASQEVLCRAVCEWAGVPLPEAEVRQRTRQLTAMFDKAGAVGPAHWWARVARKQTEAWISELVDAVRAGAYSPPDGCALQAIAQHRDQTGELLEPRIAAVEMLNVLRPTVAVAVYVTFAGLALHTYPDCRRRIQAGDNDYLSLFVQEVRRFYPFFPFVAARVREDFDWRGYHFPRDRMVLLDLHGSNHDPRSWPEPDVFRPERFRNWDESPFSLIPQGPGDHLRNHRCPGEWITIELVKDAVRFLTQEAIYDVPEQDLAITRSRLPALPRSGFVMSDVQPRKG